MTQEDKELLLKDLCMRLPYGVICQIYDHQQDYGEDIFNARLIHIDAWTSHCYFWGCSETDPYKIGQVKPYLRPMSSMTEEERIEFERLSFVYDTSDGSMLFSKKGFDWLNAHHFDYRGLIDKGLALEAPEGMYNLENK